MVNEIKCWGKICLFKIIFLTLSILSITIVVANNESVLLKGQELKESLCKYWGVDPYTAGYIANKCNPLLEDITYHPIIDDFVHKSKQLTINFSLYKDLIPVPVEDGIIQAPTQHLIIFENPWVRILWGSTQPGEHEKLHIHTWKSLIVVLKPTTYEITYADGTIEIGYWACGVYELPAMEHYACTNIGNTADECIRFEIKG